MVSTRFNYVTSSAKLSLARWVRRHGTDLPRHWPLQSISGTCHLGNTCWQFATATPLGASTQSSWTKEAELMSWLFLERRGGGHQMACFLVKWPLTRVVIAYLIVASAIGTAPAQTAAAILAESARLPWLKNWSRAEPLLSKAEERCTAACDERHAFCGT